MSKDYVFVWRAIMIRAISIVRFAGIIRLDYEGKRVAGPILAVREYRPKRARIIAQDSARRFLQVR